MTEVYASLAQQYDRLMSETPYLDWLSYIQECWANTGGQPLDVVDLGCGTGTLALALAEAGYDVTAVDISSAMLAIAKDKQTAIGPLKGTVTWLEQDMSKLELLPRADAVISICDSLNYLIEYELLCNAFKGAYEALKPGGKLLCDMHTPKYLRCLFEDQPYVYEDEQAAYQWTCDWDEHRQQIRNQLVIFSKVENSNVWQRADLEHVQRAYTIEVTIAAIEKAGFTAAKVYGDYTMAEPDEQTERYVFYAQKPLK